MPGLAVSEFLSGIHSKEDLSGNDLHTHSCRSDGSLSPEKLIAHAERLGLKHVAITDHDVMPECLEARRTASGTVVFPGVELSCVDKQRRRKVHLLCYPESYSGDFLFRFCKDVTERRASRGVRMAAIAAEHNSLTTDIILHYAARPFPDEPVLYKMNIMSALWEHGMARAIYGADFAKLFGKDGLCREEVLREFDEYPDVRETLRSLKDEGVTAIMAHPRCYHSEDLLSELVREGLLSGIEVWHPSADFAEREWLRSLADEHRLLTTGGSDFHGYYSHYDARLGEN